MIQCPICSGRGIGKVGTGQYYCWNCCLELRVKGGSVTVYAIDDEGGLVPVAAPVAAARPAEEMSCADTGGAS